MKLERDDRGFLRTQIHHHQLDNANFDVVEHIRQRMREKIDLQLPEELQIVKADDTGGEVFPVENPAEAMAEFFNNPKTY